MGPCWLDGSDSDRRAAAGSATSAKPAWRAEGLEYPLAATLLIGRVATIACYDAVPTVAFSSSIRGRWRWWLRGCSSANPLTRAFARRLRAARDFTLTNAKPLFLLEMPDQSGSSSRPSLLAVSLRCGSLAAQPGLPRLARPLEFGVRPNLDRQRGLPLARARELVSWAACSLDHSSWQPRPVGRRVFARRSSSEH